jgi:hypothetical protein
MGSANVTPTLLNMFDFRGDHDYIASDVFDSGENVVSLNNRSWISNAGFYDAFTQTFTVSDEKYLTDYLDEYIVNVNKKVYDDFLYSRIILEKNYFILLKV